LDSLPEAQSGEIVESCSIACLQEIGVIRSSLERPEEAPKQGREDAPDAWLEMHPFAVPGIDGLRAGDEIIVLTWLHLGKRDVLKVHPR
jgi:tRNA (Thr-GGU) A37 N-methylase